MLQIALLPIRPVMKTSPSFQFYPADFFQGTLLMSAAEVGAYTRLLCWQWQQGHLPAEVGRISKIAGLSPSKLENVLLKFEKGSDGLYRNARMESDRQRLEEFRERQAEAGRKGGRPPKEKGGLSKPLPEPLSKEKGSQSSQSHTQSHTQSHLPDIKGAEFTRDDGSTFQAPSLEDVLTYARGCSQIIPPNVAESYHDERTKSQWHYPKAGREFPLRGGAAEWQSDLRGYARIWRGNDAQRKQPEEPKKPRFR